MDGPFADFSYPRNVIYLVKARPGFSADCWSGTEFDVSITEFLFS